MLLLVFSFGCNSRPLTFPVDGNVTFSDGTALAGGTVELLTTGPDGKKVNARGMIDGRGGFVLRTFEDQDGALAGEHQVIVVGPSAIPSGDITKKKRGISVASRFQNYETSGLKFTVEPKENHLAITVERDK